MIFNGLTNNLFARLAIFLVKIALDQIQLIVMFVLKDSTEISMNKRVFNAKLIVEHALLPLYK